MDKQAQLLAQLNVDGNQPQGDYRRRRQERRHAQGLSRAIRRPRARKPSGQLVAQFPVTTGSGHDPLPLGNWKVSTYSFLPPFNFQPDLFWDVSDDKAEQKLPPGPNGPVGVAWLDLNKEHYGIHGTNEPQTIGKTESHGCLRLTNWDVMRLSRMMKPGFTADVRSIAARMLKVIGTALLTAVVTSFFWIWFYSLPAKQAPDNKVTAAGEKVTVDPKAEPPVTLAEGIDRRPRRACHSCAGREAGPADRYISRRLAQAALGRMTRSTSWRPRERP